MPNQNLKSVMFTTAIITMALLISMPQTHAKQTFYNSLDSEKAVKAGGGTVHGGSFEEAALGNGFIADAVGEAVSFPTDKHIQLEAGTIALWVKVLFPILKQPNRIIHVFVLFAWKRCLVHQPQPRLAIQRNLLDDKK